MEKEKEVIMQAVRLDENRKCTALNSVSFLQQIVLYVLFVLQLIAPQAMFSARLHHSIFDIFVNKSAQSTLCQAWSQLSLSEFIFLRVAVKLFDF